MADPLGWVDEARVLAAAEAEPGSWLAHGQTYEELRFSTLTQINRDNGRASLDWHGSKTSTIAFACNRRPW